jgi:hypothetical protein
MNILDEEEITVQFLTQPRSIWVDIFVQINQGEEQKIQVDSSHISMSGKLLCSFSSSCQDPERLNTEYGHGLSLIHDLKDHYFYGLGITNLSEFQTIVQTYYGREISGGTSGRAKNMDFIGRIDRAIRDELFGPRGPRVYSQTAIGLLDLYAPKASVIERKKVYMHMAHICFEIILPYLENIYFEFPLARNLQASTRDQNKLVDTFLSPLKWEDKENLLMRLIDNVGVKIHVRAYVDEKLAAMSLAIYKAIYDYVDANDLNSKYDKIFDTENYLLTSLNTQKTCL